MSFLKKNILWVLSDRVGRLLISFITGIIVARQLAPELYGVFNFSNALVGIISFLNIGAIESIVIWQLVKEPDAKEKILGSAFLLRLLGAIVTILTVIIVSSFLDRQPSIVSIIAPIIAGATLFNSIEVGEYWLRQILASRYCVISRQVALIIGSGWRIWAASSASPLLMLSCAVTLEAFLVGLSLALSLHRFGVAPWHWRVERTRCLDLFISAWPLLLATAAVGFYTRVGVIILGQWQGSREVGFFSVATIMTEATHALPLAIMASVNPILLAQRQLSEMNFTLSFSIWLRRLTWLGIGICLILFFIASPTLSLIVGYQYAGSIDVFKILIWSALFVFISIGSESWLISHNLQRYQLPKTLLAASVSIVLNLCLVKTLGAKGTAIATLFSYSVSAFWANAIFYNTRPLFRLQIKAFIPFSPQSMAKMRRS